MIVELHTTLWGEWHLGMYLRACLPTLMSPGNLPEISRNWEVQYRIYTTPGCEAEIRAHPVFHQLESIVSPEFVIMANDDETSDIDHMSVWHEAYQDARDRGGLLMMIPPDHIWPDKVLPRTIRRIVDDGYTAVALPYVILVSDTAVPEMRKIAGLGADEVTSASSITMQPWEMMQLAGRNMHPHFIALMDGGRHSRPSLERFWPVPGKGFLYRCYIREIFATDTKRMRPSDLFYGSGVDSADEIYLVPDTNEMFTGALHDLNKYAWVHFRNRTVSPLDMAACSVTGGNRVPFAWETAQQPVYYRFNEGDTSRWTRQERSSLQYFWRMMFNREALFIREKIQQVASCGSKLLSLALSRTGIADQWSRPDGCTVFVPMDRQGNRPNGIAMDQVSELAAPGNEQALVSFLFGHCVAGRYEAEDLSAVSELTTMGGAVLSATSDGEITAINGTARIVRSYVTGDMRNHIHLLDGPIVNTK